MKSPHVLNRSKHKNTSLFHPLHQSLLASAAASPQQNLRCPSLSANIQRILTKFSKDDQWRSGEGTTLVRSKSKKFEPKEPKESKSLTRSSGSSCSRLNHSSGPKRLKQLGRRVWYQPEVAWVSTGPQLDTKIKHTHQRHRTYGIF